jgi:hypothetical protein
VIIGLQTFNVVCNIEELVMKCHELYYECLTSVADLRGYILIIYGYKKYPKQYRMMHLYIADGLIVLADGKPKPSHIYSTESI